MAAQIDDLVFRITVDAEGAVKSVQSVERSVEGASKSTKKASGTFKALKKRFGELAIAGISLNQSLELTKKVFNGLAGPIKKATSLFGQQEAAQLKLAGALKIVGNFSRAALKDLQDFASNFQNLTTVGDETSLSLLATAKSMRLTNKEAKNLLRAAADLGVASGKGLQTAFQQLLKTFGGFAGELGEVIPQVKNFTAEQLRSGAAVDLIRQKFDGFAQVEAKTFLGSLKQLSNDFGDTMEEVGRLIVEVFNIPETAQELRKFLKDLQGDISDLRKRLLQVKKAFADIDFAEVAKSVRNLSVAFVALSAAIGVGQLVSAGRALGAFASAKDFAAGIQLLAGQLGSKSIVQSAKNFALASAKIILIAGAAGIAAVGVDLLIRNFQLLGPAISRAVNAEQISNLEARLKDLNAQAEGQIGRVSGAASASLLGVTDIGKSATQSQQALQKEIAATEEELKRLTGERDELVEGFDKKVDLGFLGEGLKLVKDMAKGFGEVEEAAGDAADEQNRGLVITKEQIKMARQLAAENEVLAIQLQGIGAGQLRQIELARDAEMSRIDAKLDQLRLEGKLTKEIEKQFNIRRNLVREQAERQMEDVLTVRLIDQTDIEKIRMAFGEGAGNFASSIGSIGPGIATGIGAAMNAVSGVLDFVQQLIDFIPQILEKVANIFNSLAELPSKIAAGIGDVVKSLVNFVSTFIPNILNAIPEILESLVGGLLEQLPEAFISMVEGLPDLIMNGIVARLPDLLQRFVKGMISAGPRMGIAMTVGMIKDAPKIAIEMTKVFIKEFPKAIIEGIKEGIKALIDGVKAAFGGQSLLDTSAVEDFGKKLGDVVSGVSDQVFAVLDEKAAARGLDQADRIRDIMNSAFDKGLTWWERLLGWLKQIWDFVIGALKALWEGLKGIWDFVLDALKALWSTLKQVWDAVLEGLKKLWQGLKNTWDFVIEALGKLWSGLETVWRWVDDNIIKPMKTVVQTAWSGVLNFFKNLGGTIAGAWSSVTDFFKNPGKFAARIWDGFRAIVDWFGGSGKFTQAIGKAWQPIKDFFMGLKSVINNAFSSIRSFLENFKFPSIGGGGGGSGGIAGALGFQNGGLIPGFANGGPIGGTGTGDKKIIRAEPGEFMVSNAGVDSIGQQFLTAVNAGRTAPGGQSFNFNLTVNTTEKVDGAELIDQAIDRIKERSQDGELIVSDRGIFAE